jgi:DedD protein
VEQQLKERLVGAVVVVALGVVLIPLLLDGPPGPTGPRSIGLELPAPDSDSRTHTIRLGEPREQPPVARPAPSAPPERSPERGSVSRTPVPTPEQQPAAVEPESPPVESAPVRVEPPVPAQPETGEWAVQVGSFSNPDNAGRLSRQLSAEGFPAFVARLVTDGRTMHRVRVGPVDSRESAEALVGKLSGSGHQGRVVRMQD